MVIYHRLVESPLDIAPLNGRNDTIMELNFDEKHSRR